MLWNVGQKHYRLVWDLPWSQNKCLLQLYFFSMILGDGKYQKEEKKKEESVHKIQESITSVQVLDRFIQRLLSWLMNRVLRYRSCFLLGLQGGQRELRKDWTEVWLNTLHEICCAFLRVLVQPWPVGKTFTWFYEFR